MDRFVDPAIPLYDLAAADIAVVCPRCARRAVVTAVPVEDARPISWPRRFACAACGASASWEPRGGSSMWGAPVDPFFRLPLWLSTRCCGGRLLWAFNDAHLTLLERYVAAKLRERGTRPGLTLVARLPAWLKQAKHRDEVLRAIARLRTKPGAATCCPMRCLPLRPGGGVSAGCGSQWRTCSASSSARSCRTPATGGVLPSRPP